MKLLTLHNIESKNKKLFIEAMTHKSYQNENNSKTNYERLEFLGDRVWDLIISKYLFTTLNISEGKMTRIKQDLVNEEACYNFALQLKLNEFVLLGEGEKKEKYVNKKICSDIFESFVGALFLDFGFDKTYETMNHLIIKYFNLSNMEDKDYKTRLQEHLQDEHKRTVKYIVNSEQKKMNKKWFVVGAYFNELCMGEGSGYTKQDAEKNAAKDALEKMKG